MPPTPHTPVASGKAAPTAQGRRGAVGRRHAPAGIRDIGFGGWLAAVRAVGLAIRLAYAVGVAPNLVPHGDTLLYHFTANGLADGHGYASLRSLFLGHPEPTVEHPPLYVLYLAAFSSVGLDGLRARSGP